jgi:hypothetical protein
VLDGVHECSVDIGRQGPWQRGGKPGHVAAVQDEGRWPVGPPPNGDVVEEGPQLADGASVMADRNGPPRTGDLALAGTDSVVGKKLLEVVAPQPAQRGEAGMVLGKPDAEQGHTAGSRLHALPQCGGPDPQVADERVPDDRLGNRRHSLLERGVAGVAVLGWDIDHAELVTDGMETVDQPTQRGPATRQHRDRGVDIGADGGQVVDGDVVQTGLPVHANRGQRGGRHSVDPLGDPAHRRSGLGDPVDLVGMHPRPGGVMGALGLRGQQLDIGPQRPDGEAP